MTEKLRVIGRLPQNVIFGGIETLQKNNVRKLGNRGRTSIGSPRKSVNNMKEII